MYPKLCGYTYVVGLSLEFLDEYALLIKMKLYIKCLSVVFYIYKGKVISRPLTENERHHREIHVSEVDSTDKVAREVQNFRLFPLFTVELPSSDILILSVEVLFERTFLDDESVVYISLVYESCSAVRQLFNIR